MADLRTGKIFPIGFHLGPGGNANGLKEDFLIPLDAAGIRFCIMAADMYPWDAAHIARSSGIKHTIIWRPTGIDVPLGGYTGDPVEEADIHYGATISVMPPELDPSVVHIGFLNEIDKNHADWLGRFAVRWSQNAIADGFMPAAFGWSSGEPEYEHWLEPGMADFLRLASANRDKILIMLHEYSYSVDDIYRWYPNLIGRYSKLMEACDELGIPRVAFAVTEWGWEYQDVPVIDKGMKDIANIAKEYVLLQENYGGAGWYLGPGFGGIANQFQPYIKKVAELALGWSEYIDWENNMSNGCIDSVNTRYQILRPRDMTDAQWTYLRGKMTDGHDLPGLGHVTFGIEGWAHTDIMDAIKRAIEAGYTNSRLVVMDGDEIGTGLDAAWMQANCPFLAPYTVYIDSGGGTGPNPGDPVIHNIVDDLPTHPTLDYDTRPRTNITALVIHHTTGDPFQSITNIASYHVNTKGWPGIGYHFVIDGAGKIYMTNYPETLSYHSNYANPYAMAICMQGDFTNVWPSDAQLAACKSLIDYLSKEIPTISSLIPHRDAPGASTACPGNTYTQWWHLLAGGSPPPPPPPPASGPARLGLHASADPGLAAGEAGIFRTARIEMVKHMSNLPPEHCALLRDNAVAGAPFVIRVFQDGWDRRITPQQFVEWNINDVVRYMPILDGREVSIELHNEPNLVQEGWTYSWSNGSQFADWLIPVIDAYRATLPGKKLVFPGLSPGGDVHGIRYDSYRFVQEASMAVARCDILGVHAYWQKDAWPLSKALEQVDTYRGLFPGKPIIVTEASNNRATASQSAKGSEYIQFWNELKKRPEVLGVTYFIASASNEHWGWSTGTGEVWIGTSIPDIVGSR